MLLYKIWSIGWAMLSEHSIVFPFQLYLAPLKTLIYILYLFLKAELNRRDFQKAGYLKYMSCSHMNDFNVTFVIKVWYNATKSLSFTCMQRMRETQRYCGVRMWSSEGNFEFSQPLPPPSESFRVYCGPKPLNSWLNNVAYDFFCTLANDTTTL